MLAVAWVRRLRLRRSEARSFGVGPAQALGATRGGAGEQRRAWREASPTPVRRGQCVGPPSKRSGRDGSRRISPAGAVGGRWRRTSSRPPIAAAAAASVVLLAESARAVCRFRSCSLVARPRASIRGLRLARKRGSALCAVCCAAEAARTVRPHGVRRRGSRCCGLHRSWQARHWRGNGSRQAGSRLHPRVREAGRRPCCLEHGRGGSLWRPPNLPTGGRAPASCASNEMSRHHKWFGSAAPAAKSVTALTKAAWVGSPTSFGALLSNGWLATSPKLGRSKADGARILSTSSWVLRFGCGTWVRRSRAPTNRRERRILPSANTMAASAHRPPVRRSEAWAAAGGCALPLQTR